MQQGNRESTSEQYVKRSNRWFFFIGMGLLILFLIILIVSSGEQRTQQEMVTPVNYATPDIDLFTSSPEIPKEVSSGKAGLKALPEAINMDNIVLGTEVEIPVTVTAEEANVQILAVQLAEVQKDGFELKEGTCKKGEKLVKGNSCSLYVLWKPLSLRYIQNFVNIKWREDSSLAIRENTLRIPIKAQSTEVKECVVCEAGIGTTEVLRPRSVMDMTGNILGNVDTEGYVVLNGQKYKVSSDGIVFDENNKIIGVTPPEMLPLGLDSKILGTLNAQGEVISEDGQVIGKMLNDGTIVSLEFKIIGAGIPIVSVMDDFGNVIADVQADGTIVSSTDDVLGRVLVDRSVIDLQGKRIGYLRPWGGVVNFTGDFIGVVIRDGSVMDVDNKKIGHITTNGIALSQSLEVLGAIAPQGVAIGKGCQAIGKVITSGKVLDAFNQVIGYVLPDGTILDVHKKYVIGNVVHQGLITDEKMMVLGFIDSDGRAVDPKGHPIGCLLSNGTVMASDKVIGYVFENKGMAIGYGCLSLGALAPDGRVISNAQETVGMVTVDGYVRNFKNTIIGTVIPRALALNSVCQTIGVVDANGNVSSFTGEKLGCMTPEHKVINPEAEVIGYLSKKGIKVSDDGQNEEVILFNGKSISTNQCVPAENIISSGVVLNASGYSLGMNLVGNKVFDSSGTEVGNILPNRLIRGMDGKIVGHMPFSGTAVSSEGLILGRYSPRVGGVIDAEGSRFARVLPSEAIVSSEDARIVGSLIEDNSIFYDLNHAFLGRLYVNGLLVNTKADVSGAVRADGSVIDAEGNYIGYQVPVGKRVFSFKGNEIGRVSSNGKVFSSQGIELGRLFGDNLYISSSGNISGAILNDKVIPLGGHGILGVVLPNGSVLNKTKNQIGKVLPSGIILASSGEPIGRTVPLTQLIDITGKEKGWISFNGEGIDSKSSLIGDVLMNGNILDKDNAFVAKVIPKGRVIDAEGNYLGNIMPDGRVLGNANAFIGVFKGSDYVYDKETTPLGRYIPSGIAVDLNGDFLGAVGLKGEIISSSLTNIGKIAVSNEIMSGNDITGTYVPLDMSVINNYQKIVAILGENGSVADFSGNNIGKIVSPSLVLDQNFFLLGRILTKNVFSKMFAKTNIFGELLPNGNIENISDKSPIGKVTMEKMILNFQKKLVGRLLEIGFPLSIDYKILGVMVNTGNIYKEKDLQGRTTGDNFILSTEGNIVGTILHPSIFIDVFGNFLGRSFGSTEVLTSENEVVGNSFSDGYVLGSDSSFIGAKIPLGSVMDDNGENIGVVRADAKVVASSGVNAKVLPYGDVVGNIDEDTYMPYLGKVALSGVPIGLKKGSLGRVTLAGEVVDDENKKKYTLLDDGFIVENYRELVGKTVPFGLGVDRNGAPLGVVSDAGELLNGKGEILADLSYTGFVKGKNNLSILGFIPPKSSLVIQGCSVIGIVSQAGEVINGEQKVVGRLNADGKAINKSNIPIGYLAKMGPVFSANGRFLGRVLVDGRAVNTEGAELGCLHENGKIINAQDKPIGVLIERGPVVCADKKIARVRFNGEVINANGNIIGRILGDGKGSVERTDDKEIPCFMVDASRELLFNKSEEPMGSLSGSGVFYDLKNNPVFQVQENNNITDIGSNKKIASISDKGELIDLRGNVIENIMIFQNMGNQLLGVVSGCDVLNDKGEKIGNIKSDGSVLDLNGNLFTTIKKDGELFTPSGTRMGFLRGTSTNLSMCGVKLSYSEEKLDSDFQGRRIYIGDEMFSITSAGSLLDDKGTVVGYIGEDGKPYKINGLLFPESKPFYFETETDIPRKRPEFNQKFSINPQQLEDVNSRLIAKRELMKTKSKIIQPEEKILAKAKNLEKKVKLWDGVNKNISTWKVDMSRMILKDKAIPAVLVHSIDSRYAGLPVTAIVERHIYSEEGRNIIIPAGSRFIGRYESGAGSDHVAKFNISWERLLRPDGSAFNFSGTSGDAQGRGGVAAYLDDQILSAYGKPILISVLTSAASYISATGDGSITTDTGDKYTTDKAEALADARENLIDTMDQVFQQLVNESMGTPPVVYVPSGTRLTIYSQDDLWLRSDEDDEEEYLESYGKDTDQVRGAPLSDGTPWQNKRPGQEYLPSSEEESSGEIYDESDKLESDTLISSKEQDTIYSGEETPLEENQTEQYLIDRVSQPLSREKK